MSQELVIKIEQLSGNGLDIFATLANLNISFENEALFVDLKIDKNSTDPRIGQLQDRLQLTASNGERIKVVNQDGSPSMILATDTKGNPIERVITPPEPIYEEMKSQDGEPLKDGEGNLMVDQDGKPIMELVGHTLPVLEDVYVQETIGEFEFWKIRYQALVQELLFAITRNFDSNAQEILYVKPSPIQS